MKAVISNFLPVMGEVRTDLNRYLFDALYTAPEYDPADDLVIHAWAVYRDGSYEHEELDEYIYLSEAVSVSVRSNTVYEDRKTVWERRDVMTSLYWNERKQCRLKLA